MKRADQNHVEAKRLTAIRNLEKANAANRARNAARPRSYFICKRCSVTVICKPFDAANRTYCSKQCETEDYKTRLTGAANPNFRDAGKKICAHCQREFQNYNKKRRFCSLACYRASPESREIAKHNSLKAIGVPRGPVVRKRKPLPLCCICFIRPVIQRKAKTCGRDCARVLKVTTWSKKPRRVKPKTCINCGTAYFGHKARLYCSYPCFVRSGGPFRAGLASMTMTRKYGAKKDANHAAIFKIMRDLGVPVYDLSTMGKGAPDGLAWIKEAWHLFEIKNLNTGYGRRGLNPIQKKWLGQWRGGPVFVIHNVDEAVLFAQGCFDEVKRVTSEECAIEIAKAG